MLDHYLELLFHYRRAIGRMLIILPMIVLALTVITRVTSPVYTASATVSMAPSKVELSYTDAWAKQNPGRPTDISVQTFIEYLHSTPVLEIATEKMRKSSHDKELTTKPSTMAEWLDEASQTLFFYIRRLYYTLDFGKFVLPTPDERMLDALRNSLEVEPITGTFVLRIDVSSDDPVFAALAADTIAESYVEHASAIASSRAAQLRQALEKQADKLSEELAALDRSRANILQTRGPSGIEAFNRQVQRAEDELRTARARLLSVDLDAADTSNSIQVIEPATVPIYPTSPRMLRTFLSGILGTATFAMFAVIALDLFRNKITTASHLHRLVGTAFLGTTSDDSLVHRHWWRPLHFLRRTKEADIAELRATLSAQGLFDEAEIFVAGFTGTHEANLTLERLQLAFADIPSSFSGPDSGLDLESSHLPLAYQLPKLTLLPPLTDRFQWRAVTALPSSTMILSVPAGIISAERISQVREQAAQYSHLRLFFFLVRFAHQA